MKVTDGNSWVARAFGSDLLAHLTATMQQLLYQTEARGQGLLTLTQGGGSGAARGPLA